MIHSHSNKLIKTCLVCQTSIKEIEKAGEELNRLGIWNIPKNLNAKKLHKLTTDKNWIIWERNYWLSGKNYPKVNCG